MRRRAQTSYYFSEMLRALSLCGVLFLISCDGGNSKVEDLTTTEITLPNGNKVQAEMMVRPVDLARGLMFRNSLAADRGMLFIHSKEDSYQYWMYQVRFPLDIIWMSKDRRIVEISANTPPCTAKSANDCPHYGGNVPALFVLELNAGQAAKQGLRPGDTLLF
jgi:uncharacterized protein